MWDLSCRDWQDRIRKGRSLIPPLPLFEEQADMALSIFELLRLPDVPGLPLLRDAAGAWFKDIVRVVGGSLDPRTGKRMIREIFALVPKGQSKTSYGAGLVLVLAALNLRPRAEMLFIGPTQAIADLAYSQAAGMIEADPDLKKRFQPKDHLKAIVDLRNNAVLRIKTFDLNVMTGPRPVVVLLDELHLLGRNAHAAKVLRQIRGGLEKNPEGLLIFLTTQSDEPPAGVFRDELHLARRIRDGEFRGRMLPVLYEFPPDMARDPAQWQDPENWGMVMPNLDRSVQLQSLRQDWEQERLKGDRAIRIWASQHLNLEIGIALRTDAWPGAEFWEGAELSGLTLDEVLERCELVVVCADGGGLDDLFGVGVLGRCGETKDWLFWGHAWCHESVLERRRTIASTLKDFEAAGELTIVGDALDDVADIVALVDRIQSLGLLSCVAVDPAAIGELVDALAAIGVTQEDGLVVGVPQGWALMNAIKTTERKLANGTLWHCGSRLMAWAVGNLRIEPTATAIRATKQNAGDAKIDPVMALFNGAYVMSTNPEPKAHQSIYDMEQAWSGTGLAGHEA